MKPSKNTNTQTAFLTKDRKKESRCFKCSKHGHFANMCRSKPKKSFGGNPQKTEEKQKEKAFVALLSSSKATDTGTWIHAPLPISPTGKFFYQ